jgi:hypothetical protein
MTVKDKQTAFVLKAINETKENFNRLCARATPRVQCAFTAKEQADFFNALLKVKQSVAEAWKLV